MSISDWSSDVCSSDLPALSRHDIFFLPTFGENYGHVIAEALEAGLRLLICDQTPWRGLAEAGVGHDLPLNQPEAFVTAIEAEAARTTRMVEAERAYAHLTKGFAVDAVIDANRRLRLAPDWWANRWTPTDFAYRFTTEKNE